MTTYGTFSIDSVPAPDDGELEAADRRNALRRWARRRERDSHRVPESVKAAVYEALEGEEPQPQPALMCGG